MTRRARATFRAWATAGARRSGLISATIAPTWSEPEPDREILRPIAHHEGDSLAARDPGAQRPTRILVHTRLERAEAEALAVADERRRIAILAGPLRHRARQNAFGVAGRLRGGLQSAQPSPSRRRCGVVVRVGVGNPFIAPSSQSPRAILFPSRGPLREVCPSPLYFRRSEQQLRNAGDRWREGGQKECRRSETTWRRRHDP